MKQKLAFMVLCAFCFVLSNCVQSQKQKESQKPSTEEVHRYLKEVALGSEFGQNDAIIQKWQKEMRIYVSGEESKFLKQELNRIMKEINVLTKPHLRLKRVEDEDSSDFHIFYGYPKAYLEIEPNAKPLVSSNIGLFYVYANSQNQLNSGNMYLDTYRATDTKTQAHILREELTQALGLMNDSYEYKESIFYQGWTLTLEFAEIDKALIRLLYQPKIKSGMGAEELEEVLNTR